jgi:hypothetical protein
MYPGVVSATKLNWETTSEQNGFQVFLSPNALCRNHKGGIERVRIAANQSISGARGFGEELEGCFHLNNNLIVISRYLKILDSWRMNVD